MSLGVRPARYGGIGGTPDRPDGGILHREHRRPPASAPASGSGAPGVGVPPPHASVGRRGGGGAASGGSVSVSAPAPVVTEADIVGGGAVASVSSGSTAAVSMWVVPDRSDVPGGGFPTTFSVGRGGGRGVSDSVGCGSAAACFVAGASSARSDFTAEVLSERRAGTMTGAEIFDGAPVTSVSPGSTPPFPRGSSRTGRTGREEVSQRPFPSGGVAVHLAPFCAARPLPVSLPETPPARPSSISGAFPASVPEGGICCFVDIGADGASVRPHLPSVVSNLFSGGLAATVGARLPGPFASFFFFTTAAVLALATRAGAWVTKSSGHDGVLTAMA